MFYKEELSGSMFPGLFWKIGSHTVNTYSEPCPTSNMERFAKKVNGWKTYYSHWNGATCQKQLLAEVFKIGVVKNFARFTGKHLC